MSKRLDSARGAATTVDANELDALLTTEARDLVRKSDGLVALMAAQTDTRYPRRHLLGRDACTLPDADRLRALADDAARGEWSVFGQSVAVDRPNWWTTHPVTGAPTESKHWRRIRYMNGVAGADVKFIWELNRHQGLVRIAQGYFVGRREALAERVVSLLDDWVLANPPGRGINWTSSLEIGFRAIAWCWIWSLTCDARAWTDERLSRFLVSLWHHARHIDRYDSTHHSPNTHLTGELLALYYVGLTFPVLKQARRWAQRGRAVLTSELERQVFADGMHFERSVGYHRYTAEFYLHFALLARAAGEPLPPEMFTRVKGLVEASWVTRLPDGRWPVIGDEDSGSTLLVGTGDTQSHSTILAVGAGLFGESRWMSGVDAAGRSGAWWLLDDAAWTSLGTLPETSDQGSGALPVAGYFVGREHAGDDAWYCLVDAGAHGGERTGHAHTDIGHVEIAHGAVRVVVDPGCASYTTNPPLRDWCRSERAHACVVIDDTPLALPRGPFAWQRLPSQPTAASGEDANAWWCELAYRRPTNETAVIHRRQVVLVRGCGVVIADWLETDAPVSFAVHWPLATAGAALDDTRVRAPGFVGQWNVVVGTAGRAELRDIQTSPGYARQHEAKLVAVAVQSTGSAMLVTAFTSDDVNMSVTSDDGRAMSCSLRGEKSWTVRLTPGRAPNVTTNLDLRG